MPTYVYRCATCNREVELVQKISEKEAPVCDTDGCGTKMDSVIQPSTFVLKGPGWAKDGYGSKK